MALLSRWPITNVRRHVGPGRLAVLEADVRAPAQTIHVLVVHLFPTDPFEPSERRTRHDDYRLREAQLALRTVAAARAPTLVLGDFDVVRCDAITSRASDHRPVRVELRSR